MNLSLTGNLGSGKSSLGKELIARGFEIVSSGDIFRGLAAERGVSIVEMNKIAETDKSIDKMVDDRTIALGKSKDHTIFDSRMGWHFVPDSFKVFVMVDLQEAGKRVYNDSLRKAETYRDVKDAVFIKTVKFLRISHENGMTQDVFRRIGIFLVIQSVLASEIGDPAFCGNTRTSEKYNVFTAFDPFFQPFDLFIHILLPSFSMGSCPSGSVTSFSLYMSLPVFPVR